MEPLLRIGTFGVHLILNPAKTFSFAGTIPSELNHAIYHTEEEGQKAFVNWFKNQSIENQKLWVGNLRNDIFKMVFES